VNGKERRVARREAAAEQRRKRLAAFNLIFSETREPFNRDIYAQPSVSKINTCLAAAPDDRLSRLAFKADYWHDTTLLSTAKPHAIGDDGRKLVWTSFRQQDGEKARVMRLLKSLPYSDSIDLGITGYYFAHTPESDELIPFKIENYAAPGQQEIPILVMLNDFEAQYPVAQLHLGMEAITRYEV
jgi:hypothetical protein